MFQLWGGRALQEGLSHECSVGKLTGASLTGLRVVSDDAPAGESVASGHGTLTIQTLDEREPGEVSMERPHPEYGLYVCGILGSQEVNLLIDSEATVSILSSILFQPLDPGISS